MFSCFKGLQKEEETSSSFLENGSSLLEDLIRSFSGRYKNPIRCFTARELITATSNFSDRELLRDNEKNFRGFIEDQPILVKIFREKCPRSPTFYGAIIRDIVVTSQMSHLKNVLKLRGCCLEFKFPALVYEQAGTKLLTDLLPSDGNKVFSLRNKLQIAKGIANAIAYLHTAFPTTIVYRNLKPSKVIIDKDGIPKLFDFSLSIPIPRGESQVEDVVRGTWGYVDAEYMETGIVTEKTDVYGFGVLLLVMLTGKDVMCKSDGGGMIHIADYVKYHVGISQLVNCIIAFDKDANQENQLHSLFNLAMECTKEKAEERPDMINVAKSLYRILGGLSHC